MNANRQWIALLTEDEDDYFYWQYGFKSYAAHLQLEWFATSEAFFAKPGLIAAKPAVVLLDGLMPKGEESILLEIILKHECCQGLTVLMLSELFSDNQRQTYLQMGAADCLLMPTSQQELQQAVLQINQYAVS